MTNERSSLIIIGGEQYEMILTTRATKAISNRYGGLDNLGDIHTLLLLAFYIGKLNIVAENFEHLHKGLIHNGIALFYEPIHILTRCADFLSEFRLCHISFDAFHFDIDFKIVLDHISIPLLFLASFLLVYCTHSVIYYITEL